ncbi:hypothetical protein MNBD_GAMMA02-1571 [hydrothermal vent metagenome]|uniref:NYN domain-containing protein n=1 Tax=hydrothermal vent metagenome TaxID=652676 RepID=A0A3B0WBT7_9ZZZZ
MLKIGVFVDVQNIYYTTRDAFGRSFDYRAFWQHLSQQGEIVTANAYAISRNVDDQKKFQSALRHIGFEVKLKPFIQRSDGSAKGDWDVGITIDIMEAAKDLDQIVLLSGDGDFAILLKHMMGKYAVNTHVYGVTQLTADALINTANKFIPINATWLQKQK